MRERERVWIKSRIREYYEKNDLEVRDLEKREFGIGGFEKKIEKRHLCFNTKEEFKGFLIQTAPLYISYSSSLYKYPCNTPMEKKERISTELIFDLDGEGWDKKSLGEVKEELKKLLIILKEDFGIKDYTINFSGNRGFHVHVHDKKFSSLSQNARKKIVDYLLGNVDYTKFFSLEDGILYGPKIGDGGIRGRFVREFLNILENNPSLLGRKVEKEQWKKAVETGNYSLIPLSSNKIILERMKRIFENLKIRRIDIDAGVTYDISKLIRVPNSIHGSTGLVAKVLKEEEIDDFDPFRDALAFDDFAEVVYSKSFKIIEDGKEKIKRKGVKERINKSLAMFFVLKGLAIIP